MGNISKEHIGYVVAILSVIASGIISWYFYDKSQQYRLPVYSVEPFSSAVFKANEKKEFPFKKMAGMYVHTWKTTEEMGAPFNPNDTQL